MINAILAAEDAVVAQVQGALNGINAAVIAILVVALWRFAHAGVSRIDIERAANKVKVNVHTTTDATGRSSVSLAGSNSMIFSTSSAMTP